MHIVYLGIWVLSDVTNELEPADTGRKDEI